MEKKLNLLAEFILKKYKSDQTLIEICDCENFIVVKGFTTEPEVISLSSVVSEFSEKYEQFLISRTIDLIEYKSDFSSPKKFTFFFSKKFNKCGNLFDFSEFPYGYSNGQGKLLYFYFKHIVDRIPSSYPFTWMKFHVEILEENKIDFTIEDDYLNNNNNILKSAILDCFDFNLMEFESVLNKMDLEKYILNPSEQPQLESISVKDFIII